MTQRQGFLAGVTWTLAALLASFAFWATLFAARPAAAGEAIGSARTVKPDASETVSGTLSAGSAVHAGASVKTGSAGQAGLQFHDQTKLQVGPSSDVRLDKFVYDPNKGAGSVAIGVARGSLRFSVPQGTAAKLKTPYGTLGVRG